MSNDTGKFLALAALGIGAYLFLVKRPAAQIPTPAQIPQQQGVSNPYRGVVSDLAGRLLGGLFSGGLNGTVDGRAATPWDTQGVFNNPSAYASSAIDGLAYNPPADSPFDAAYISVNNVPTFEVDPGWTFFQ